jgi:hypothetical protein
MGKRGKIGFRLKATGKEEGTNGEMGNRRDDDWKILKRMT